MSKDGGFFRRFLFFLKIVINKIELVIVMSRVNVKLVMVRYRKKVELLRIKEELFGGWKLLVFIWGDDVCDILDFLGEVFFNIE